MTTDNNMRHENDVKEVCGEEWRDASLDEVDGGYGIAIMLAFLNGARPTIESISDYLRVDQNEIEVAFRRLQSNNVFSPKFNARQDVALLDYHHPEFNVAWGQIAGMSSGWIGAGYYLQRQELETAVT